MSYLNEELVLNNIANVQKEIEKTCLRVGRNPKEVKLIAVSKTVGIEQVKWALKKVNNFGENRVQELQKKYDIINETCKWHFIGRLQTNKVKYIIDKVELIHSLDRISLANELQKQAQKKEIIINTLIQVNVAEEETKAGIKVDEVLSFSKEISKYPNIRVKGLMTVAPFDEDPEKVRYVFRKLKKVSIDIKEENIDNIDMEILSMGMTNDYKIAIEEGATIIRVGSAIFGRRVY